MNVPPPLLGLRPLVELTVTLWADGRSVTSQIHDFRGEGHLGDTARVLLAACHRLRIETEMARAAVPVAPSPALWPEPCDPAS